MQVDLRQDYLKGHPEHETVSSEKKKEEKLQTLHAAEKDKFLRTL